jgi:hypothetical protein
MSGLQEAGTLWRPVLSSDFMQPNAANKCQPGNYAGFSVMFQGRQFHIGRAWKRHKLVL